MKTVLWVLLIVAVGGVIWFGSQYRDGLMPRRYADVLSSENVQLLNQLNKEWSLLDGFTLDDVQLNGMRMNWVHAPNATSDRVILQLHGGAYQRSLDENGVTYQRAAAKYAAISGARVLTIDYRVAPDHPFPAALEDAVAAYGWLLDNGYQADNIIIAGDSAGGGLTLATALYLRDHQLPLPAALITMSAWTNLDYKRLNVPYIGDNDASNPYISPIYGEYTDLPPMLMQVGGAEVLLSDTLTVAQKAREAGVTVQQSTYEGMCHVFQMLFPALSTANAAWDEVEAFIGTVYK